MRGPQGSWAEVEGRRAARRGRMKGWREGVCLMVVDSGASDDGWLETEVADCQGLMYGGVEVVKSGDVYLGCAR